MKPCTQVPIAAYNDLSASWSRDDVEPRIGRPGALRRTRICGVSFCSSCPSSACCWLCQNAGFANIHPIQSSECSSESASEVATTQNPPGRLGSGDTATEEAFFNGDVAATGSFLRAVIATGVILVDEDGFFAGVDFTRPALNGSWGAGELPEPLAHPATRLRAKGPGRMTRPGPPHVACRYSPRTFWMAPTRTYGSALNPNSSSARKPVTF